MALWLPFILICFYIYLQYHYSPKPENRRVRPVGISITSCSPREVIYQYVLDYAVQQIHADNFSLRDYFQLFNVDFASRRVLKKSILLQKQRDRLFMEMWLQGIVKKAQYTFLHQGETYICDFVSNGSIHWMNFGKTIYLSSSTCPFPITLWRHFEDRFHVCDETALAIFLERLKCARVDIAESVNRYWEKYVVVRERLVRELENVLDCRFRRCNYNYIWTTLNRNGHTSTETDPAIVHRWFAIYLAIGIDQALAEDIASNKVLDLEYFEEVAKKYYKRMVISRDTMVDI